jgi:hypothetical protein
MKDQYQQTAMMTSLTRDTGATAKVDDYIINPARHDAGYYFAGGFGFFLCVVLMVVWFVDYRQNYQLLVFAAVAFGLCMAGVGGHYRLNIQIADYDSLARSTVTETQQPVPVARETPQPSRIIPAQNGTQQHVQERPSKQVTHLSQSFIFVGRHLMKLERDTERNITREDGFTSSNWGLVRDIMTGLGYWRLDAKDHKHYWTEAGREWLRVE